MDTDEPLALVIALAARLPAIFPIFSDDPPAAVAVAGVTADTHKRLAA